MSDKKPTMTLYGPHCSHEDCGWLECDLSEDQPIAHACKEHATCPYCGPDGPHWPQVSHDNEAWLLSVFGTIDPHQIRQHPTVTGSTNTNWSTAFMYADVLHTHQPRHRDVHDPTQRG